MNEQLLDTPPPAELSEAEEASLGNKNPVDYQEFLRGEEKKMGEDMPTDFNARQEFYKAIYRKFFSA